MATKWKQFKLTDLVTISNKRVTNFDGQKEYVATGDIDRDKIVSSQSVTYSDRPSRADLLLTPYDVLFAKMKGTVKVLVGKKEYEDKIFSTGFYIITPKENVSLDFIYFFLISKEFNLQKDSYCTGATMSAITNEGLIKIKINMPVNEDGTPDLEYQNNLASLLYKAENLKNKRLEANQKTDELLPSLFVKMFGDPEAGTNKFPVVDLNTVCLYVTDGTHQSPKFTDSGIPFLFVKNIVSGKIDFDTEKYISEEIYQDLTKKYKPKVGNILYSTVGSYGVAVEIKEDRKFSFQRHIGHISPDISKINPTFLCAQLNTPFVKKQADLRARGVAQKTVNLQEIKKFKLVLPPIELQNKFTLLVEEIEIQKNKQKGSTQKIDELFNAVMAKSFA